MLEFPFPAAPTLKPASRGSVLALLKGSRHCLISSLHLQPKQLCMGISPGHMSTAGHINLQGQAVTGP